MGETISKVFCCNLGTKEIRILMLGLDNAGKTSKKNIHQLFINICLIVFVLSDTL